MRATNDGVIDDHSPPEFNDMSVTLTKIKALKPDGWFRPREGGRSCGQTVEACRSCAVVALTHATRRRCRSCKAAENVFGPLNGIADAYKGCVGSVEEFANSSRRPTNEAPVSGGPVGGGGECLCHPSSAHELDRNGARCHRRHKHSTRSRSVNFDETGRTSPSGGVTQVQGKYVVGEPAKWPPQAVVRAAR